MRRGVFLIVPYIMSRMFDKEVDIEGEKVNIENKKVDIEGSKVDIGERNLRYLANESVLLLYAHLGIM